MSDEPDLGIIVELGPNCAYLADGSLPNDLRPHIQTTGNETHWRLNEEIHAWLVERNVDYELGWETSDEWGGNLFNYTWLVSILDTKMGILFKLTFA